MTDEMARWTVAVESERGARLAAAYELPWWMLGLTRRALLPASDPAFDACLRRVSGRANQEWLLGKRPYRKTEFVYAAADEAPAVAERAIHWLRVSTGMWRSELPSYAQRNLVRFSALPDPVVEAQTPDGARCECALCEQLRPSPSNEARLLAHFGQPLAFQAAQDVGLWIASLREPSEALVRALVDGSVSVFGDATSAYAGQFKPTKVFRLLAERSPASRGVLASGIDAPLAPVRAFALAAMGVELDQQRVPWASVEAVVERALFGEVPEAFEALDLLRNHGSGDPEVWALRITRMLRGISRYVYPYSHLVSNAFATQTDLLRDREIPEEVRAFAETFLAAVVPDHLAANAARLLLRR